MKAVSFKLSDLLLKMRIPVFLCLIGFWGAAPDAAAQDVHVKVRSSLVILKATALDKLAQPAKGGVATGFIVTTDGHILTAYHLISQLGDIDFKTLNIEAKFEDGPLKPTTVLGGSIMSDLLLLKLPTPPDDKPYAKLTLGNAYRHPDNEQIYTSGFANGNLYRRQVGTITGRDGPSASLWTTSIPAQKGESGSPVYNGRGQVIGVVKGTDDAINCMVTIESADNLLSFIRFLEIRDAMSDFDALRMKFNWEARAQSNTIIIFYEKLVPGEPYVKEIDVELRGVASSNGQLTRTPSKKFNALKPVAANGRIGHSFEFPREALAEWQHSAENLGYDLTSLELIVVSKLTDDQKMRAQRLTIDYREFRDGH
jgi:hypothetical protein